MTIVSSRYAPASTPRVAHPDWARSATIYRLDQGRFTAEGTFRAAREHLPRLRDLGIDIIWLTPVQPAVVLPRRGGPGGSYAVHEHRSVDPRFGTMRELRAFVAAAHALGMHVILDWDACFTSPDSPLVTEHPEWFARDSQGNVRTSPWSHRDEVLALDHADEDLRCYLAESMRHWVREADVDGFRCDAAAAAPRDFWERVRADLTVVKPVFLLAEAEERDLHEAAFDATRARSWNETMHRIAEGTADVGALRRYFARSACWPRDAIRMTYVTDHDENPWADSAFPAFGPMRPGAIVLSVVGEGMPLLHNGQEAGDHRGTADTDPAPLAWREDPAAGFYKQLFALKKAHPALWNGAWGAPAVEVPNDMDRAVLSFVRSHQDGDEVFAVFNFTGSHRTVTFGRGPHDGAWVDAFDGSPLRGREGQRLDLAAWGWRVFVR